MRSFRTLAWLALIVLAPSLEAQITSEEYAARRVALAERMGDGVVIAFGGREPVRHWPPFYQHPAFRYLTGFLESNAAFVMVRQNGRTTSTIFVEKGNARTALYNGVRATLEEISERLGLEARYNDELGEYVESMISRGLPIFSVPDVQSNEYSASDSLTAGRNFIRSLIAAHPGLRVEERSRWVDELRAKKSDAEIALLKTAADMSSRAHEAAMRAIRPGIRESEIQAVMEAEYRKLGADSPGYSSIVGAGPNSTVLHYPAGTRVAESGEVVLMDVAAYYQGYSADITRTVPVDRKFSPTHRDVYEIVLAAQKAAERVIETDAPISAPTVAAYDVLKDGLVRLGLIKSVDASFDAPFGLCPGAWANDDGTCPQWYLYVYHGFFHGIGLDVHDPSQFAIGARRFQPGDVFTIEPGIYVREAVFEGLPDTPRNRALIAYSQASVDRYVNIGVRIEDNYVLTAEGLERISDVPREIDEIEALRSRPVSE